MEGPVATVKYIKNKMIYKEDVIKKVELFKGTFGKTPSYSDLKKIVDAEIDQELFTQEVEKMGIRVEKQEIDKQVEQQKMQITGGQPISDEDFKKMMLEKTGISFDEFKKNVEFGLLQQKYISTKFPNLMTNAKKPTNSEVEDAYNSNVTYFLTPLLVRYEQIFFSTMKKSTTEKKALKTKIDTFYKNIKAGGKTTFDKYVTDSLNDPDYQGGDPGPAPLSQDSEQQIISTIGESFLKTLKTTSIGTFSPVIETKIGYHIIYITDRSKPKLLTLDDAVSPGNSMTVREYIKNMLLSQEQQKLFMTKVNEFVTGIRKSATITIDENILKSMKKYYE